MSDRSTTQFLAFFTDMADRAKEVVAREEALREMTEHTFDDLKTLATSLTGEQKVQLLRAMGFSPMGSRHQDDCTRYTHGPGFICICVPPATVWTQPHDVDVFRKETWEDRKALADKWSREGSHGREKDDND